MKIFINFVKKFLVEKRIKVRVKTLGKIKAKKKIKASLLLIFDFSTRLYLLINSSYFLVGLAEKLTQKFC